MKPHGKLIRLNCLVLLPALLQRLVFSWIDDNASGNNAAIAIDSVTVVSRIGTSCDVGLGNFNVGSIPSTAVREQPVDSMMTSTVSRLIIAMILSSTARMLCGHLHNHWDKWQLTWMLRLHSLRRWRCCDGVTLADVRALSGNCVSYIQDSQMEVKGMCVTVNAGTTYLYDNENISRFNDYDRILLLWVLLLSAPPVRILLWFPHYHSIQ